MTSARQRRAAMHARNAGLQRLRSITKRVGIATALLTGVFAGLAAAGNPGHHRHKAVSGTGAAPAEPATTTATVPAPPGLPPIRGDEGQSAPTPSPSPAPAPPSQVPVQTQQPPVVTSGGS